MKNIILILLLTFTFISCKNTKSEENHIESKLSIAFNNIYDIKITQRTTSYIDFFSKAIFKNPNMINGRLISEKGLKLFFNDKEATTFQIESFKVPNKKEFILPLNKDLINYNKIFKNEGRDFLGLTSDILKSRAISIRIQGELTFVSNNLKQKILINDIQEIKLKDN